MAPILDPIDQAIAELQTAAGLDAEWLASWWHGLPTALDPEADGANIPHLLFIYNCMVGWGLEAYSKDRFRSLVWNVGNNERLGVVSGDHWTPGLPVVHGGMVVEEGPLGSGGELESVIEARYAPLLPEAYKHRERALMALAYVHEALA